MYDFYTLFTTGFEEFCILGKQTGSLITDEIIGSYTLKQKKIKLKFYGFFLSS